MHPVTDPDFSVSVVGGMLLERVTEYCQWDESYIDQETRDRDGNLISVHRTYIYTKGWHSFRIPSVIFAQPFGHHNPLRDPFPGGVVDVADTFVGSFFRLPASLILKSSLRAEHSVISFDPSTPEIRDFYHSDAARNHQFYYTDQNGWFYSHYVASQGEGFLRLAGMFMEGSLFQLDIGHIFSSCTAGDIRVRFRSVIPKTGLSVIAKQADNQGSLSHFNSSQGAFFSFIHEGIHSPQFMIDAEKKDAFWMTLMYFFLALIVVLILFCIFAARQ
jgi:hypothetical protein